MVGADRSPSRYRAVVHEGWAKISRQACTPLEGGYPNDMPLSNIVLAEEALSLSATERAELAELLIRSLEGDPRTDGEIKAELARRLEDLKSGADAGLTFKETFDR